jgi:hypothetical protein
MKNINISMFYSGAIIINNVLVCNDLPEPIPNDITSFNTDIYNSIINHTYEIILQK